MKHRGSLHVGQNILEGLSKQASTSSQRDSSMPDQQENYSHDLDNGESLQRSGSQLGHARESAPQGMQDGRRRQASNLRRDAEDEIQRVGSPPIANIVSAENEENALEGSHDFEYRRAFTMEGVTKFEQRGCSRTDSMEGLQTSGVRAQRK